MVPVIDTGQTQVPVGRAGLGLDRCGPVGLLACVVPVTAASSPSSPTYEPEPAAQPAEPQITDSKDPGTAPPLHGTLLTLSPDEHVLYTGGSIEFLDEAHPRASVSRTRRPSTVLTNELGADSTRWGAQFPACGEGALRWSAAYHQEVQDDN
jgi:hypothetical protein